MTSHSSKGIRVADSTWPLVAQRLATGAIGLLPIGAASKAHGRHLPMNTDQLQAEWLATQLVTRANVVVWPTLSYGYYPAFTDYPGSISLSEECFVGLTVDILNAMHHGGAKQALIINTGISTIPPLEIAIEQAQEFESLKLINIYRGQAFLAAEKALMEQRRGSHADEIETSIMLAIAPERVDMSQAEACADRDITGPLNRTDPHAANYSPSGVYGDPTLASVEKGQRLLAAMLADLQAVIDSSC